MYHQGTFPSHAQADSAYRTHLGAQQVPAWHSCCQSNGQQSWSIRCVHSFGKEFVNPSSVYHMGRAFFLLGEGIVESHGLPGLVPEPNPFVRAPQQETCVTSYVYHTFYSYSMRDL